MPITRHELSEIYSKVVEANGLVFTSGIIPTDLSRDAKGQTEEVLKRDRPSARAVWDGQVEDRDGATSG